MAVGPATRGSTEARTAARGLAAAGESGSEPPAGGGEERRTRGWKARPPRVFTILEPEKEKKGGWGLQKMETGCEMKRKERKGLYIGRGRGGGGGGGGGQMKGFG